jgi:hypothetical protein
LIELAQYEVTCPLISQDYFWKFWYNGVGTSDMKYNFPTFTIKVKARPNMENSYFKNKVTFPIIPDDAVLTSDNRVIMTNKQLLTKNPDAATERFVPSASAPTASENSVTSVAETGEAFQDTTFEMRRQMPTTAGKRPLSKNFKAQAMPPKPKKKSALVEEARKRVRENAVPPKPIKQYVNPLERASSDELGIKNLANKKVVKSQHSLGKAVSTFDKTAAKQNNPSLFDDPQQDYFASKHRHRDSFDVVN